MEQSYKLLIINPGSTSTKISVFKDREEIFQLTVHHSTEVLDNFPRIIEQLPYRKSMILTTLMENNFPLKEFNAIVGRGGLLKPLKGGTYKVGPIMIRDLCIEARGSHASNLGGIIAYEIAESLGIPAFVVDPVTVDEMEDVARITGLPEIQRLSIFHALNQKATARRLSVELGKKYDEINLIVAHLGGGISIGAHKKGRIIDVNNALAGDGPFSPERAGSLPVGGLVDLCFRGYTKEEVNKKLIGQGGLVAHLGTNNASVVEDMMTKGDDKAKIVYEAMAYQVAKAIGGCATVLKGNVDAIVITGGIANSQCITDYIRERVSFVAPVYVYPGEDEMEALALGGLRVLKGEEVAALYENGTG